MIQFQSKLMSEKAYVCRSLSYSAHLDNFWEVTREIMKYYNVEIAAEREKLRNDRF